MRARDDQLRLFLRCDRGCAVDCPQRRLRAVRADDDCPIAHIASISRLTTTRHYRPDFIFEAHWAHPAERAPGRSPHLATFCEESLSATVSEPCVNPRGLARLGIRHRHDV